MSTATRVIVSEVALDPRNGAGFRAILPYLEQISRTSEAVTASLYLIDTGNLGQGIPGTRYIRVPYVKRLGFRALSILLGGWVQLHRNVGREASFLVLPNSIRDILLGLICRVYSPNVTVWVMDDFVGSRSKGGPRAWLFRKLFGILYRSARRRGVVSAAMDRSYREIYGVGADFVLGRTLKRVLPPAASAARAGRKLRMVYVGSFLSHYWEPIEALRKIPGEFCIDLYGINPPPENWLAKDRVIYRGALEGDRLLETLQEYDFGLLPYSFDSATVRMMSLSFPSKLVDYLGAALPVVTIAPQGLEFLWDLRGKGVGPVLNSVDPGEVSRLVAGLGTISAEEYSRWQESAHRWARAEFMEEAGKVQGIF
jgi:hypothetical protein